jgi:threonylcarbamoyladenosine tRNA methylthiotransferase MtaB
MASFSVSFLGCKVSYADAQAVRERLLRDGHAEVSDAADVAVVNTCCVTHEAISKSRQAVSRAARSHGHVYVTGCGANLRGAFDATAPNVTVVALPSEEMPIAVSAGVGALGCVQADARLERTRAFVKIQDGCSFSCSFCVIPLVRGATRSRRADAVLGEIERRVAQGHREIVLTGVNLGCFRDREAGYTLPRLVREAGALPAVERLRLSSIEVNHVTDDLVAALRETPAASRHLHVPLQSGDDTVLRAMRRRYSAAQYVAKLGPLADFNLTADVIVGFPSEDEEAFRRTLEVVEQAGLSRLHVFPYSPRPGTRTDGVDPVLPPVKKERSTRLRALSDELSRRRWAAKLGSTDRVLIDRPGRGYGDDYTPWLVAGDVGQLLHARALGVVEEGILAVAA